MQMAPGLRNMAAMTCELMRLTSTSADIMSRIWSPSGMRPGSTLRTRPKAPSAFARASLLRMRRPRPLANMTRDDAGSCVRRVRTTLSFFAGQRPRSGRVAWRWSQPAQNLRANMSR